MNAVYERDLDLNLLRVFAVVADARSVTRAASRLYLTQPAVSAALRRLRSFVGAPLFARHGRGLVLTSRGTELLAAAHRHLGPLVEAVMAPPAFDPKSSNATVRLGLSESTEGWLLPPLLARLRDQAPGMQTIVISVQFRTVEEVLLSRQVDLALSIADALPQAVLRRPLVSTGFVCVYDPRCLRLPRQLSEKEYFACEHVIISYAGDVRGIIEDTFGKARRVRVSVPSFNYVGDILDGAPLLATVPEPLARHILRGRPQLRAVPMPPSLSLEGPNLELLWLRMLDDDPVSRFVRGLVEQVMVPLRLHPKSTPKRSVRKRR